VSLSAYQSFLQQKIAITDQFGFEVEEYPPGFFDVPPLHQTPAWMHEKYVEDGLDCAQIAKMVGRDPKTIWYFLKKFDIPTRPRGSNEAVRFKKGERSRWAGRTPSPETREKLRQACLNDGRVPYLKDGKPWMQGRTGALNPRWKGGATPERQEFYRLPEWKSAVKAVYGREGSCCQRCHLHISDLRKAGQRLHVHHIVTFAVKELRLALHNLALLCAKCHQWAHGKSNIGFLFIGLPIDFISSPRFENWRKSRPSLHAVHQ
jgi:hypothetical protein